MEKWDPENKQKKQIFLNKKIKKTRNENILKTKKHKNKHDKKSKKIYLKKNLRKTKKIDSF